VPKTPPNVNKEWPCVIQYKRDTSSRVYDSGGERVSETPPNLSNEKTIKHYRINVDKPNLCTAATHSYDSVANLPTTL